MALELFWGMCPEMEAADCCHTTVSHLKAATLALTPEIYSIDQLPALGLPDKNGASHLFRDR